MLFGRGYAFLIFDETAASDLGLRYFATAQANALKDDLVGVRSSDTSSYSHDLVSFQVLGQETMTAASESSSSVDGAPSYFLAARRRVNSDPSSPSISPSSHPASTPPRSRRRSRPPVRPHEKAKSDEVTGYSRFGVQTIDENEASQDSVPLSVVARQPVRGRSSHNSAVTPASDEGSQLGRRSVSISQRTSSSFASINSAIKRFLLRSSSDQKRLSSTSNPPVKSKKGHGRARSESGTGKVKAKSSGNPLGRKTRSAEILTRRHFRDSSESRGLSPTAPLRPPVSRNISEVGPAYRHKITMETDFTELRSDAPGLPSHKEPPPSRKSSLVRPQAIFTAPLDLLRKLRRPSNTTPAVPPTTSSRATSEAHGTMPGHISQLRRRQTSNALRQVSEILRLVAGDRADALSVEPKFSKAHTQTMSSRSSPSLQTPRGTKRWSRKKTLRPPSSPVGLVSQKSMELVQQGSASSSIRKLRLGPPPNATPEEKATYKIKRSPSAETEEFLKVDISIHGGTSYLPSEARRIHTPPLPEAGAGGKRRGFFFDYNAPEHLSVDGNKSTARDANVRLSVAGEAGIGREIMKPDEDWPASRQTFDRKTYPALSKGNKNRAVEWYDTKLAELDTYIEIEEESSDKGSVNEGDASTGFSELRRRTAQALHEMRTRNARALQLETDQNAGLSEEVQVKDEQAEGEIDYNVPEHYPNSPLCPANAKYWRFVDGKLGKGKYTRTCWMHGELLA